MSSQESWNWSSGAFGLTICAITGRSISMSASMSSTSANGLSEKRLSSPNSMKAPPTAWQSFW